LNGLRYSITDCSLGHGIHNAQTYTEMQFDSYISEEMKRYARENVEPDTSYAKIPSDCLNTFIIERLDNA